MVFHHLFLIQTPKLLTTHLSTSTTREQILRHTLDSKVNRPFVAHQVVSAITAGMPESWVQQGQVHPLPYTHKILGVVWVQAMSVQWVHNLLNNTDINIC